ncbi:hypothetical protein predicted by Glimmer/Critica [Sorangium cellulosum So ce56]|uniref:Transposase DDE domain-containing protein n=1 Tax=Sorangium cellulosum (strain So ce56) TaxID=448385 RepID=A9FVC7_SORC5|nr:hypothetical protein predicted by Glimmer/Critica [Sorangium cellulosum So ce56]
MTKRRHTPSTSKVRRRELGFKRKGDGRHQGRIRRPDPAGIHVEPTEKNLTGVAGLAPFGAFIRELGIDAALSRRFSGLKTGRTVIYPMAAQMRLLMDSALAGEERVFGIEALAVYPLFVRLAGGVVPSIDTVYRDLCRFDEEALDALHSMVVDHGLALVARRKHRFVHIDVDTTVEPLFGMQAGGHCRARTHATAAGRAIIRSWRASPRSRPLSGPSCDRATRASAKPMCPSSRSASTGRAPQRRARPSTCGSTARGIAAP